LAVTRKSAVIIMGENPTPTGVFDRRRAHHAESFLTGNKRIPTSIVNAVQGYPKVDRISDTTFKRYEFMRSSA
jgi:hypothetical protein